MNEVQKLFKIELLAHQPNFEIREGQLEMAKGVQDFLSGKAHYFIEAGTGVGKSLAYLIPAAKRAVTTGEKIIVSTYSKALQSQLVEKDIPLVQALFKSEHKLNVVVVKGRSNYVCLRRYHGVWNAFQRQKLAGQLQLWEEKTPLAGEQLSKIAPHIEEGLGEKDQFPFRVDSIWDEICSQKNNCLRFRCPWKKQCFITKNREAQVDAHLLIVNHALFFADLSLKSRSCALVPDYHSVIFDEAHHLEDVVANAYGVEANLEKIRGFSQALVHPSSAFGQAVRLNEHFYKDINRLRDELDKQSREFFEGLSQWIYKENTFLYQSGFLEKSGLYSALRVILSFIEPSEVKDILTLSYEAEGERENIVAAGRELLQDLEFLLQADSEDFVFWIERDYASNAKLCANPVEPGNILAEALFVDKPVLFTSATLAAGGEFSYMAQRLGVAQYKSVICASPFNYKEQCLLLVPKNGVHPSHEKFHDYIIEAVKSIVKETRGRAFILFTSYKTLSYCYDQLHDWMLTEGFAPLAQGRGLTPYQLLEQFKQERFPILFGTNSFWEGVDIPGDKLSCVIVTKLPFAVPSHPLEAARMKRIKTLGKNDFLEYAVPKAVLRFKQGFGRLIRTSQDRGVVAVLDPRLRASSYGKYFIQSLPQATYSCDLEEIRGFVR